MKMQKRWDRHDGYFTAYWVDVEKPRFIFDSDLNEIVSYADLPVEYQNIIDFAIDDFEDGCNTVIKLGRKLYEKMDHYRFSILREIEGLAETVYNLSDFKEG